MVSLMWKRVLFLASGLSPVAAHAQTGRIPQVTVVDSLGSVTVLRKVEILTYSNRGFVRGSSYQAFGGLFTTPAVRLPPGVSPRPGFLAWREMARISFDSVQGTSPDQRQFSTVTLQDGSVRTVFLWTEGYDGVFIHAWDSWFQLEGELLVQNQAVRAVQFAPSRGALVLGWKSQP